MPFVCFVRLDPAWSKSHLEINDHRSTHIFSPFHASASFFQYPVSFVFLKIEVAANFFGFQSSDGKVTLKAIIHDQLRAAIVAQR